MSPRTSRNWELLIEPSQAGVAMPQVAVMDLIFAIEQHGIFKHGILLLKETHCY
jgi:hypothetical protein